MSSERAQATEAPRIRTAVKADVSVLTRLLMDSFAFYGQAIPPASKTREALERHAFCEQPLCEVLLAEFEGEAVAFAIFGPVFWTGDLSPAIFLEELYVNKRARNRGIGRMLMAHLASVAMERGCKRIIWNVDRPNSRGIAFYERLPGAFRLNKHAYAISGESLADLAALASG
ncbi:MAG: GNAT family N-acetyltransferase [Rhodovibrionaceae bacterium]|nr:GNAT family N-acetyltransferase [Rhodovibrionaceae bacterium]